MDKSSLAVAGTCALIAVGLAFKFIAKARARASLSDFDRLLGRTEPLKQSSPKPANPTAVSALKQELRAKFFHDETKVADAINYERERNPTGNDEDWLRAAIYRWNRLMQ